MADKYLAINGTTGRRMEVEGTVTSAGAGNAGELVALDGSGLLDVSVLPVGVGPDVDTIEASENLAAGDWVNLHDSTGIKVRKADNSNSRECNGFVLASVTSGQNATVYRAGYNTAVSGLTVGTVYFLGTGGAETATVPGSGTLLQQLGKADDAASVYFTYEQPTERA